MISNKIPQSIIVRKKTTFSKNINNEIKEKYK